MPRFFSLLRRSGPAGNDRDQRGPLLLRGLALLALATLTLGCLLTGPAAVTLPPPGSVAPATLTTGSPRGFYTLYAGPGTFDAYKVWLATSPVELSALWKETAIPWPMPEVDFDAYVVVAGAWSGSYCGEEIASFSLDDRGVLRNEVVSFKSWCELMAVPAVYVAALARVALPPRVIVKLDLPEGHITDSGQVYDMIGVDPTAAVTFAEPGKEPGPDIGALEGPLGTLRATLPLPPEGAAVPSFLDDGTPVWLMHHEGGDVSVLSAFSEHLPLQTSSANTLVAIEWDRSLRRFSKWYDERGVPVRGRAMPSLPRYHAEVVSGPACAAEPSSRCVRVGDIAPGSPRRHAAPRPKRKSKANLFPSTHASALKNKSISIREALSRHEGRVVLLDAALVLEDGKPERVCDVWHKEERRFHYIGPHRDVARCSESAPVVGQRPWKCDACKYVVYGPLFARVERGHLRDVVSTSGEADDFDISVAESSPRTPMYQEIGAGFTAAFGGSGFSGGTEVSWGLHGAFNGGLAPTSREMRVLVGNRFGFDLRAQLTHRGGGAGVETTVALGIAGRLNQAYDWVRLPSLLGLFAPEVGVLFDSRETTRLYMGASLPIAFLNRYTFRGLELLPTLRYVPETGLFAGVLSLKAVNQW